VACRALIWIEKSDEMAAYVALNTRTIPAEKADRVLINLHGGGFTSDSGSLVESVPVASLTQTKVISVLYRLAPEHPFPAAVEDTVAVYKELLKTYKPEKIGIYGSSAGAVLTPEVAVQLKMSGLPLPEALGSSRAAATSQRLAIPSSSSAWAGSRVRRTPGQMECSGSESMLVLRIRRTPCSPPTSPICTECLRLSL
jgi:hypothetical protein